MFEGICLFGDGTVEASCLGVYICCGDGAEEASCLGVFVCCCDGTVEASCLGVFVCLVMGQWRLVVWGYLFVW